MKKLLTLVLALVMMASMSLTAFAADTNIITEIDLTEGKATSNVTVTYNASSNNEEGTEEGKGAQDSETWTVTIPATVKADGQSVAITATGSFAPTKTLKVTVPNIVKLYLDGEADNDYAELTVTFSGINLIGSYTQESVTATGNLTVEDMSEIKFGSWSGTLTFTIEMNEDTKHTGGNVITNN